jgi:hypothetical protein
VWGTLCRAPGLVKQRRQQTALHANFGAHESSHDPERNDVIRTYLKAYGDALALERRGTHIIVYFDESYVHQNHAPTESWLKEDGDRHVERSSSNMNMNTVPR